MNELKIHIEKHGIAVVSEIDGTPIEVASTMGTVLGRAVAEMAEEYKAPYDEILALLIEIFTTAMRRSKTDTVTVNLEGFFKK